jgi:hypothetical protein
LSRLQIIRCEHAKAPALAWLARALVAEHGGSILINSKENVGTAETIELPLSQRKRGCLDVRRLFGTSSNRRRSWPNGNQQFEIPVT